MFLPSARLGGDALGYEPLDPHTFLIYLIDVSGHGVGAAMHSVSVLNVLRQRAVPNVDFRDPAQVLTGLNAMFQMDRHDDQYVTMWYGVYDAQNRTLAYASAGHHPGYLVTSDRKSALPLKTFGVVVGAVLEPNFTAAHAFVPAESSLYLCSDGAFEILTTDRQCNLDDFLPLLQQCGSARRDWRSTARRISSPRSLRIAPSPRSFRSSAMSPRPSPPFCPDAAQPQIG
jgi:serine phosphatase RsbU (regulator of sigma subunit)